jgi:hypothetical protein
VAHWASQASLKNRGNRCKLVSQAFFRLCVFRDLGYEILRELNLAERTLNGKEAASLQFLYSYTSLKYMEQILSMAVIIVRLLLEPQQ